LFICGELPTASLLLTSSKLAVALLNIYIYIYKAY
jgi:hypothetical protein